jgi:predicted nucleotidyltransferase
MKIIAIIAEYNPFHNGHKYLIQDSKKSLNADGIIAIMSGNFTQRGEPAILNKWVRTRAALSGGTDLVIELPFSYVSTSAEFFAQGALNVLDKTNTCDYLAFGSEYGNIIPLKKIASCLVDEPNEYVVILKHYLSHGHSFVYSRNKAIEQYLGPLYGDIIKTPNNILGIEYLKALKKLHSIIEPFTLQRIGTGYHSHNTTDKIASATYLRNQIKHENSENVISTIKKYVPENLSSMYISEFTTQNANAFHYWEKSVMATLTRLKPSDLLKYTDVNEGLENRLIKTLQHTVNYHDFIKMCATKRYPSSRISRIIANVFINYKKQDFEKFYMPSFVPYVKVLGFNQTGQQILKKMKKQSSIPILTNLAQNQVHLSQSNKQMLALDVRSSNLYNLLFESEHQYGTDYINNPIILK